jgi:hypothetical protein
MTATVTADLSDPRHAALANSMLADHWLLDSLESFTSITPDEFFSLCDHDMEGASRAYDIVWGVYSDLKFGATPDELKESKYKVCHWARRLRIKEARLQEIVRRFLAPEEEPFRIAFLDITCDIIEDIKGRVPQELTY